MNRISFFARCASAVTVLILFSLFLGPVAALLAHANATAFLTLLGKPAFLKSITTTLLTALPAAFVSVLIASGFARYFGKYTWRFKRVQRLLLLIPFLVPNFVLATAYVTAWNPTTGLLNSVIKFPFELYGDFGLLALFTVSHLPVAFLLLESTFTQLDMSLIEAARMSGANTWQILKRVETPLIFPSLIRSSVLCFSLNISAFAIPAWIGAPARAYTLSFKIYQSIQLGGQDGYPQAACYGFVLFLLLLPTLVVLSLIKNRDKFANAQRRQVRPAKPRRISALLFQLCFWLSQLLFWIGPMGCLFFSTFVPPGCLQSKGLSCGSDLSFATYKYVLFGLPETPLAFKGSFIYGSLAAFTILVFCVLFAAFFRRKRLALRAGEFAFSLAAAAPGAVLALGAIILYSGRYGINLYNSAAIVVLVFVIKHTNLAFQPLWAGLELLPVSFSEASRLSGANAFETWRRILIPLLKAELVGGFFLVLVPILGELTMSVFLVSPQYRSVGTLLFDLQDYADQGSAAALSVILIISILFLNEISRLLTKGRVGY